MPQYAIARRGKTWGGFLSSRSDHNFNIMVALLDYVHILKFYSFMGD